MKLVNIDYLPNEEITEILGLVKGTVVQSKNILGSHKDRHENIGFGSLGFDTIYKIITNETLKDIPKILETPYIGDIDEDKKRLYPPYKFEIEMLKKGEFNPLLKENIRKEYQISK